MNSLIGKKAPNFNLKAIVNGKMIDQFSLNSLKGKYVIFFFYPLDFTFVCPTELHAFQDRLKDFETRNAQLVACSTDSCFSHSAWLNTPRNQGGIQGIKYPLVSDINKEASRAFGVLKEGEGIAYRGLFLLDQEGIIRHCVVNDLPLGRSVDEALRMVDALACFEKHGEVCPANWHEGERTMKTTSEGLADYFSKEKVGV